MEVLWYAMVNVFLSPTRTSRFIEHAVEETEIIYTPDGSLNMTMYFYPLVLRFMYSYLLRSQHYTIIVDLECIL